MFAKEKKESKSAEQILKEFETAKEKLVSDLEEIGIEEKNPSVEIVKAYQEERLVIDSKENAIVYKLKNPVKYENGSFLSTVKVRQPLTGELKEAYKEKNNELAMSVLLLSLVSGVPLGILDRTTTTDIGVMVLLIGFFQ